MIGISLAVPGGRSASSFWQTPFYLASPAGGGADNGPAALLDLSKERYALTVATEIATAPAALLNTLETKPLSSLLSITRPGAATYIDADGLLKTAPADQPRFDYTNGRRQLLLEGPATNLLPASSDFAGAGWGKGRVSTIADQVGPDGIANSACRLVATTATGAHYTTASTPVSAGVHSLSLFVKHRNHRWFFARIFDGASSFFVCFDLQNGVVSRASAGATGTIELQASGFYRVSVSANTLAASGTIWLGLNQTGTASSAESWTPTGVEEVVIFGAQLESGSRPTSYIATAGSAVTRPADKAQLAAPVVALLRRSAASVLLQGQNLSGLGTMRLMGAEDYFPIISLNQTGDLRFDPSMIIKSGVTQPTSSFGVAISIDRTGPIRSGSYNASPPQSLATQLNATLTKAYIGRDETASPDRFANGWYDQLVIWPFRMTDADLQAKAVPHA